MNIIGECVSVCARAHVDAKHLVSRQDSGVAAVCAGSLHSLPVCFCPGGFADCLFGGRCHTGREAQELCVCVFVRAHVCVYVYQRNDCLHAASDPVGQHKPSCVPPQDD